MFSFKDIRTARAMDQRLGAVKQASYQVNRFNPAHESLNEPSVVEDWMPKDPAGINMLMRQIYIRDAIAGPAVDLYKELPWSDFELLGVDDPEQRKIYEDACSALDLLEWLPDLAGEFLVLGKIIATMLFNEKKGFWDHLIIHDADAVRITPIPIAGAEPKIDLRPTPAMRQFAGSQDPRDLDARQKLPKHLLQQIMQGGWIPLDPLNTIYLPRRATAIDAVGTSFFTRIINYWAFEKSILNATVVAAKRRAGGILHLSLGTEAWEPSREEMEDIAALFIQADEDPVGGIVATRTGVEANQLSGKQGDIWKLSDEWSFLYEAKMKALGINDAFLSGDASYSTMDVALSVFLERIRAFRDYFARHLMQRQIFETLARVHGFVQRKQAELDHRIRTTKMADLGDVKIDRSGRDAEPGDLIIPTVHWKKQLNPVADENYLNILTTLEEKGLPVTLRRWAAAGGYTIEEELKSLDEDIELKKVIAKWKKKTGGEGEEKEEGGSFAMYKEARVDNLAAVPVWDRTGRFLQLEYDEAIEAFESVIDKGGFTAIKTMEDLKKRIASPVDANGRKMELVQYLMHRMGYIRKAEISADTYKDIAMWLYQQNNSEQDAIKATRELYFLSKMQKSAFGEPKVTSEHMQTAASREFGPMSDDLKIMQKREAGVKGSKLLTGV